MPPDDRHNSVNNTAQVNTAGLSLDELIAVCEELASLDRAGLPMIPALRRSSRDVSRRIGRVRSQLADHLASGRPLSDIASTMVGSKSRGGGALQTALKAGLQASRPADALEAYVQAARQLADTRAMIARASVYPIFVMLLACGVFLLVGQLVSPQMTAMYADFDLEMPPLLATITQHGTTMALVAVGVVALLVLWLALWWRTGAILGGSSWLSLPLSVVPGWGGFVRAASRACGIRLFGLMLRSGVPLDECLEQSAQLSSSPRDREWAAKTAAALRAGTRPEEAFSESPFLPRLVVWWLISGEPAAMTSDRIRRYTDEEFARLAHRAQFLQSVGPALATIAVGTTAGVCYGLSMFAPLYSLLEKMSLPL